MTTDYRLKQRHKNDVMGGRGREKGRGHRPVGAVDLVSGATEGVDHLGAVVPVSAGSHVIAHVDVCRKHAVEEPFVLSRTYVAEPVVGERLVELPDVVRDILLVAIGDVAGGADLELLLGGVDALGEGDLSALARLRKASVLFIVARGRSTAGRDMIVGSALHLV